jgi:S1-C subfamily serine protease
VIGINTAMASNAQSIGFAIPINQARTAIDSYTRSGKIVKPYLGVSYVSITKDIADSQKLPVANGAWLQSSSGQASVIAGGPAASAGLKDGDIITAINGQTIDENHPLASVIANSKPGDEVSVKYLRDGKETTVKVKLGSIG